MVGLQDNTNPEPKSTKYRNIHLSRSNSSLEFKDHLRASKKTTSPLFMKKDLFGGSHENNSIQSDKHILSYHQHSFNMIRDQFENPNKSISNSNSNSNSNKSEISSPKLKSKFNRFWNHNNVKQQSMNSADDSLSSTLMSTSITSVNNNSNQNQNQNQTQTQNQSHNHSYLLNGHSNTTAVSTSADMEERQRRRAFCHYDCQSLTANLSYAAKLRGVLLARRRNTTTGASAASITLSNVRSNSPEADSQNGEEDYGDGQSNDLLENCPYFRNEIGGEEERVVSLTRVHAGNKQSFDVYGKKFVHKPPLAYGMSILEFGSGETHWRHATCPYQRLPLPIENIDRGALYYRDHFYGQDHTNWFGIDEQLGPIAVSIKREKLSTSVDNNQNLYNHQYRLVIRTSELATLRGAILEEAIPNLKLTNSNHNNSHNTQKLLNVKEILEFIAPEVQLSCLKLGMSTQQTEDQILKLDEQGLTNRYKIGIMYCRTGQSTEEEMYNNEESGPAFLEFLDTIGQRVRLKGFDKYKAGLDTKTDSTGLYSVYTQYQDCEIMFHVSTLLPFTANNRQQLLRKRHIGNDIVTIVFQEPGSLPFTPKSIRSQFQHVFIIVRAINPCTENTHYSIAVSRSKDVPVFGPPIKEDAIFPKSKTFADFLLAKVINAENATHQSDKFVTMATRTRQEYLKDLATNYSTNTVLDLGQKFSIFSSKKKEKIRPPFISDNIQKGAICWQVILDDSGQSIMVECFMGLSSDTLVLIEECSRQIVFVTPCKSILGWCAQTNSLRIYHHQGECCTIHMRDSSADRDELMEIIDRLKAVTKGCAVQELSLKRNCMGQLGFHVQPDGIVTQVENTGHAWQAGLRPGARIVEICKIAVSTLTHDQMVDLLKTSLLVTVTVVPPLDDNSARRGCTLHNCMFNSGFESDYDTNQNAMVTLSTTADRKGAQLQKPVANSNRKQLYDRGFSPPRSSSSSGYGTGNSTKSLHANVHGQGHFQGQGRVRSTVLESQLAQPNDGTMTSSSSGHSSDDRWYDILESHTELMVNSTSDLVATILPPTPSFSHLNKKSVNNSTFSNNFQKHSDSINLTPAKVPKSQTTADTHRKSHISTSSSTHRHNPTEVKLRMNSNVGRSTPNSSNRNSANYSINSTTLQEDLMKLINPEIIEDETASPIRKTTNTSTCQSQAQFSPLSHSSSTGNLLNGFSKSALIANRCRSRDALNIALSLTNHSSLDKQYCVTSTLKKPTTNFSGKEVFDDDENGSTSFWSHDDITVTKKPSISEIIQPVERGELLDNLPPDLSITSVPELQSHLTELESRVNMEAKRRLSLENEVKRLRDENRRLQDESQTAAHQLRKFTEWFFQTIDKQ